MPKGKKKTTPVIYSTVDTIQPDVENNIVIKEHVRELLHLEVAQFLSTTETPVKFDKQIPLIQLFNKVYNRNIKEKTCSACSGIHTYYYDTLTKWCAIKEAEFIKSVYEV